MWISLKRPIYFLYFWSLAKCLYKMQQGICLGRKRNKIVSFFSYFLVPLGIKGSLESCRRRFQSQSALGYDAVWSTINLRGRKIEIDGIMLATGMPITRNDGVRVDPIKLMWKCWRPSIPYDNLTSWICKVENLLSKLRWMCTQI